MKFNKVFFYLIQFQTFKCKFQLSGRQIKGNCQWLWLLISQCKDAIINQRHWKKLLESHHDTFMIFYIKAAAIDEWSEDIICMKKTHWFLKTGSGFSPEKNSLFLCRLKAEYFCHDIIYLHLQLLDRVDRKRSLMCYAFISRTQHVISTGNIRIFMWTEA